MKASAVFAALVVFATPLAAQLSAVTDVGGCEDKATDHDRDGLSDACELGLAIAFAPILVVRSAGCNWDRSVLPSRLAGGYFHAVQPVDAIVRIAYLPAYFQDCGWAGSKCWIPWVDCSPHRGDSELIVVEIRSEGPASWRSTGIFLSAHCFGRSSDSCRWYRGADLAEFEWIDSGPVVWVAEGRQANYASWRACDEGHYSLDTCDRHDEWYRFPVIMERNVGSRAYPSPESGCVNGAVLGHESVVAQAVECFWHSHVPFRGWQDQGRGSTAYSRYLAEVAGF